MALFVLTGELCDFPLSSYGQSLQLHLGRNARNLASQSIQRIQDSKQAGGCLPFDCFPLIVTCGKMWLFSVGYHMWQHVIVILWLVFWNKFSDFSIVLFYVQLQGHDFYWRALLNILLTKLRYPVPSRIYGMRNLIKRSLSFYDYAKKSVEKLGLNSDVVSAV